MVAKWTMEWTKAARPRQPQRRKPNELLPAKPADSAAEKGLSGSAFMPGMTFRTLVGAMAIPSARHQEGSTQAFAENPFVQNNPTRQACPRCATRASIDQSEIEGFPEMFKHKLIASTVFATIAATAPAKAFCLFGCEPTNDDARKVFENLVKKKFDPDAKIQNFEVTRFWRLDVEGSGHAGVEFYFTAKVEFPKGANLDCKPEGPEETVKAGCSASTYYSTTIQNKMIKDRQYIEPGKVVEFKDETRFDQERNGWKGQDGNIY
jgi:hypothetical protein